jgi:branched-chain amino acid transport system substrate-binding protein
VDLVWLDEATPQDAVQSITRLIEETKVVAVLGGTSSATTLAMGSVVKRVRVPFISLNAAAREVTGAECTIYPLKLHSAVHQRCAPDTLEGEGHVFET